MFKFRGNKDLEESKDTLENMSPVRSPMSPIHVKGNNRRKSNIFNDINKIVSQKMMMLG